MAAKRKRRERGAGSIYQNRDGTYTAQARIEGHLIRRRAPDRQAAEAALEELLKLKRNKIDVASGLQTLEAWLNVWYTQVLAQRDIKARTAEFYRDMIERYLIPHLGSYRLLDVRPAHIQAFVDSLRLEIRERGHDGARTVRGAAGVLKEALSVAAARKLIPESPYSGVILPTLRPARIVPLDDSQSRALLVAVAGHRLAPLYATALTLGLRRGELLGLRWASLDWDAGTLTIDQQAQRLEGKRVALASPKTRDSVRTLPLPRGLLAQLREHWQNQQEERKLLGPEWKEHGLIFPSEVGTPMWPDNLESHFRRARSRAGLPDTVKLHHLRHTVSTMLDEAGASEALKAGILGHAKQTQTQRYTHARDAAMRRVLQAVEERLLGAGEQARAAND